MNVADRRGSRGWFGLVALLACVSITAWAPSVRGQTSREDEPFSTSSSRWEGYSEFVRLAQRTLGTARIKPSATLDFRKLEPQDAVIIVHPSRPLDEASLSAFLADGGRVALLDDFGKGTGLLRKFGIERINAPSDPEQRLRNNPDLAVAVPSVQVVAGAERGRHPITQHVDSVVTNHPVVFRHPDLTPVLEIRDRSGRVDALAVTGVIARRGRLLALGDPSVFINLMLRYPGNRQLAEGMVDYLANRTDQDPTSPQSAREGQVGPEEQARSRIWIVTNDFDQEGTYGETDSLLEHIRRKMDDAAAALASMDEEGIPPALAIALAAALALFALSSQLKNDLVLPRLSSQSFSRAPLLAAQTGLGARAEILSSKNASPILALMEMDAAIRETIARRLGINPAGTKDELSRAFTEKGLSPDDAAHLSNLLSEFRAYGQSLGRGRPRRTTEASMNNYHRESMRLLETIERTGKTS